MSSAPSTVIRILATYTSGHTLSEYVIAGGVHKGLTRTGLLTPQGRPCKTMPALADMEAPKPKQEPKAPAEVVVVAQTASPAPSLPAVDAGPPREDETFAAFASRSGLKWSDASPVWKAHKDAQSETARFPSNPPVREEFDAVEASPTDDVTEQVDAVLGGTRKERRAARKAAKDAQVKRYVTTDDRLDRIEAMILALASK